MILRRAATYVVLAAMLAVGMAFLLATLYMVNGSLELYPTEEQEDKVRLVAAIAVASFAFAEVLLWLLFKHLKSKGNLTMPSTGRAKIARR